jgi:hypothetical protein
MPHPLTDLPHQSEHAVLGKAIPLTYLGSGRPGHVLRNQTLDCLRVKPLTDLSLSPTATATNPPSRWNPHQVRQQRWVQFESPQADHAYFRPTRASMFEPDSTKA